MRTFKHKKEPRMSITVMQETRIIITGIAVYQLELLLHVELLLGETRMKTCILIWRTYICYSTQYISDFTHFIRLESHLWRIQIC
jgi:hypothetical protein